MAAQPNIAKRLQGMLVSDIAIRHQIMSKPREAQCLQMMSQLKMTIHHQIMLQHQVTLRHRMV